MREIRQYSQAERELYNKKVQEFMIRTREEMETEHSKRETEIRLAVQSFKKKLIHQHVYLNIGRMVDRTEGEGGSPIHNTTLDGTQIASLYQHYGHEVGFLDGYSLYRDLIKKVKIECRDCYHEKTPEQVNDQGELLPYWRPPHVFYLSNLVRKASKDLADGPTTYLKWYEDETEILSKRMIKQQERAKRRMLKIQGYEEELRKVFTEEESN